MEDMHTPMRAAAPHTTPASRGNIASMMDVISPPEILATIWRAVGNFISAKRIAMKRKTANVAQKSEFKMAAVSLAKVPLSTEKVKR